MNTEEQKTKIQYDPSLTSRLMLVRLELTTGRSKRKDREVEDRAVTERSAEKGSIRAVSDLFHPKDIEPLVSMSAKIREDFSRPIWTYSYTGAGNKVQWRCCRTNRVSALRAEFEPRLETRTMKAETMGYDWAGVLERAQQYRGTGFKRSDYPDDGLKWAADWGWKLHRNVLVSSNNIILDAGQGLVDEMKRDLDRSLKQGLDEALVGVRDALAESLERLGLPPVGPDGKSRPRTKWADTLHQTPAELAKCLRQAVLDLEVEAPDVDRIATEIEAFAHDTARTWDLIKDDESQQDQMFRRALELASALKGVEL